MKARNRMHRQIRKRPECINYASERAVHKVERLKFISVTADVLTIGGTSSPPRPAFTGGQIRTWF